MVVSHGGHSWSPGTSPGWRTPISNCFLGPSASCGFLLPLPTVCTFSLVAGKVFLMGHTMLIFPHLLHKLRDEGGKAPQRMKCGEWTTLQASAGRVTAWLAVTRCRDKVYSSRWGLKQGKAYSHNDTGNKMIRDFPRR